MRLCSKSERHLPDTCKKTIQVNRARQHFFSFFIGTLFAVGIVGIHPAYAADPSFDAYQRDAQQKFESAKRNAHGTSNTDAKKNSMDEQFQKMKEEMEKSSQKMYGGGLESTLPSPNAGDKGSLNAARGANENSIDELQSDLAGELEKNGADGSTTQRKTSRGKVEKPSSSNDGADNGETELPSTGFTEKLKSFKVPLIVGTFGLLGLMAFLFAQGRRLPSDGEPLNDEEERKD